jgi:hypothetical protein
VKPDERPSAHAEFLQRALVSAAEWTRFADPKVLAVLVFLGLGMNDLVDHAGDLVDGGWFTTASFCLACALAVVTVVCASVALFPRLDPRERRAGASESLYYFAGIAGHRSAGDYETAVRAKTPEQLESELARQAFELSTIALYKLQWARRGYVAAMLFLGFWALARIAEAL